MAKYYKRPDGLFETIRTIDGKRVAFRGRTVKDVDKKLLDFKGVQIQGRPFPAVAHEWWNIHTPTIAYTTMYGYRKNFARILDTFGSLRVTEIKPQHINSALIDLSQQYGKKVVASFYSILKMILDYATVKGDIPYNPALSVSLPKNLRSARRELPSDEELQKVKQSNCDGLNLLPHLLLYTGCRRGEALALTWGDIDFKNDIIRINKAIYFEHNRPKVKKPKTDNGIRVIPLLKPLKDKLRPRAPALPIFGDREGNYLAEDVTRKAFYKWREQNGVTLTMHQLRHGYATILFEAGLSPKEMQELLGHSQISTTMDIYTHLRKEKLTQATNRLNAYFEMF